MKDYIYVLPPVPNPMIYIYINTVIDYLTNIPYI